MTQKPSCDTSPKTKPTFGSEAFFAAIKKASGTPRFDEETSAEQTSPPQGGSPSGMYPVDKEVAHTWKLLGSAPINGGMSQTGLCFPVVDSDLVRIVTESVFVVEKNGS